MRRGRAAGAGAGMAGKAGRVPGAGGGGASGYWAGVPDAMPGSGAGGRGHEKAPQPFGRGAGVRRGGLDCVRKHRKAHDQPKDDQQGEAQGNASYCTAHKRKASRSIVSTLSASNPSASGFSNSASAAWQAESKEAFCFCLGVPY